MKKNPFLLIIIMLIAVKANCQLDKKNWLVGGSGTFNSINDNFQSTTVATEYKRTVLLLTPNIGYFVTDKFAVGLRSTFSWRKDVGVSAGSGYSRTLRVDYGPFVRYYFLDKEKQYNVLTDLSYQFGRVKFYNNDGGPRNSFSIMAGPALYFNSSVAIEFLLGYNYNKEKQTRSTTSTQFFYTDINKGFQASIGLQIHLQKFKT